LRRPFSSIVIGATLAAAVPLSLYLATHRPTVLRLVPGTMLANEFRDDRTYSLRVRQGDDARAGTAWDWEVELRDAAGVVVGAPPRITALAMTRAAENEGERFGEYLIERRVPDALRDFWRIAWSKDPQVVGDPASARRRDGSPITIELSCNGRPVALEKSSFTGDELRVGSGADGFEVLFVEPSEDCPDPPLPP
jgi:hypothetical protein